MEISRHVEIAIRQGVDPDLLRRKIIEAINEAIQLSMVGRVDKHGQ